MEPQQAFLESHWQRSFAALGLPVPKDVFEALLSRYREPRRAYHTLQHIGECITLQASLHNAPAELGAAIWFHDAIYDPHARDNEKRSAAWAGAVLGDVRARSQIEKMILATKPGAGAQDEPSKLMADIDLAILAVPEPRYSEYEAQIRREYDWVDELAYRAERKKLLQGFVDRPFIFGTLELRSRFETRARRNLERSINALIVAKRG